MKLLYKSEYYYKNRLASLAKGDMIERQYGKVILGYKGKQYLNNIGFNCRNINRSESYRKRIERISDIAYKFKNCGWYFEPSWRCDINTYTKRGNRFIGILSRREKLFNEDINDFNKLAYLVYFLHKDITPRELKYIDREIKRNQRHFQGIIMFVEDERFLKYPKFIDVNTSEIYTILYKQEIWKIFEKFLDKDYMKKKVLSIFGDEFKDLKTYILECYYRKMGNYYDYIFPIMFADFSKIHWINYAVGSRDFENVNLKVVCEENCIEYVRKFLDERVEIICLSRG